MRRHWFSSENREVKWQNSSTSSPPFAKKTAVCSSKSRRWNKKKKPADQKTVLWHCPCRLPACPMSQQFRHCTRKCYFVLCKKCLVALLNNCYCSGVLQICMRFWTVAALFKTNEVTAWGWFIFRSLAGYIGNLLNLRPKTDLKGLSADIKWVSSM